jgi:spermidine/putrescine transport system permease protein
MIPLWSNYLVKIYSWKAVLGTNGVINYTLQKIGVISAPLDFLLYDTTAVVIALTSALLPFMVLPILTALERIPNSMREAATDLGSSPRRAFWTVTVPLARRGMLAGASFVLVMSMGDIIASETLGGPSGILVGRVVFSQFGAADNWPVGAAMSYVLIAVMIVLLVAMARLAGIGTRERMTIVGSDARLEG